MVAVDRSGGYFLFKDSCNYLVGSIPRGVLACFFAKIPRHTRQNAITEGDLECILTRNCKGTEQLQILFLIDKPGSCNTECNKIDCQDQDTEVIDSTAGSNGTDQMTGL